MKLTVNIKNAPGEVNRPYIVVRFCAGELWYYGQYDDVERAGDVAERLGWATVFDNSSYNVTLEQESMLEGIRAEIEQDAFNDVNGSKYIFVNRVNQIIDKYISGKEQE